MPLTLVCPQGHRMKVASVPPSARVRCPKCGEIVVVPSDPEADEHITASPPPPLPDDEQSDDDAEKRRRKKKKRQLRERVAGLEKVNLGLAFQYVRLLLLIVTMLGWIMLVALSFAGFFGAMRAGGVRGMLQIGPTVLAWGITIQTILGISGSTLCLFVPQAAGTSLVVGAALVIDTLAFVGFISDRLAQPAWVIFWLGLPDALGILMGLVSWILFIFFMQQLATYLDEESTARRAKDLQMYGIALLVGAPIVLLGGGFVLGFIPCIGVLIFLGLVAAYLVFLVKFLFTILDVIISLRKVIAHREYASWQPQHWIIAGIPACGCTAILLVVWLLTAPPARLGGPRALANVNAPAVQPAANERQQIANNFKQIGLAFHNFHDVHKHFPKSAIFDEDGNPLLSWRVAILPYVEHDALYKQFKLDESWDSADNKKLLAKMPAIFAPPGSKGSTATFIQVFTGKGTLFEGDKAIRLADVTDGTSNTLLAVEAGEAVPWTKPDDLPYDPKKPLPKLGGASKEGLHMLFADGSVRFGRHTFNESVFRLIITRNDGKTVDLGDLYR